LSGTFRQEGALRNRTITTLGVALTLALWQARPGVADPVAPQDPFWTTPQGQTLSQIFQDCINDSTPEYCGPLKPVVDQIKRRLAVPSTRASTVSANAVAAHVQAFQAGLASDSRRDTALFANGQSPGPAGPTTPPNGGGANVSLAATSDTKTASFSLNLDLAKKGQLTDGYSNSLSITAQTPVGQGQDYQNLATLDGLTKSTSIGFQYNYLHVASHTNDQAINQPYYQATCAALLRELQTDDPNAKINPDWTQPFGCHAGDVGDFVEADSNLSAGKKDPLAAALHSLDLKDIPTITSVWMVSLNGKVGYEAHTYYDGMTLAKSMVDRTPAQLGVSGTYVFDQGNWSGTLSYNYQKAYEDGGASGKMQTLCPTKGNPVLKCINGYIGAPTEKDKDLLSLEARYISPPGKFPIPFGIDPTVTYDAHSGVYGVEVPIYVVANASKSLTGGIRYDWTSDKHQSVVGVFVASAFCILPGYKGCPSGSSSTQSDKGGAAAAPAPAP
jgi:hypothetical protein